MAASELCADYNMTGFLSLFSSLPLPKFTQSETASQAKSAEPVLESEDGEGKHEESSLDVLSKDR